MKTVVFLSALLTLGALIIGCYMKLEGFNRCGNWIIIIALVRMLFGSININTDDRDHEE